MSKRLQLLRNKFLNYFGIKEGSPSEETIYYFDETEDRCLKARILSKYNYPSYYNIQFTDINRPIDGLYLIPGQAWSF